MPDLETLYLEGTRITDAGLERLASHKKLSFLMVGRTQVTPDGVARLQALLPECHILSRDLSAVRERSSATPLRP
jgi:hypothetical protein